jgi:hypothetical protein
VPPTAPTCARCGAAGEVVRGAAREAAAGTVAGLLEAGWLLSCPAAHRAPPPVGAAVADEVARRLPQARRRALSRTDRCGSCDAPLTMPVRRTERSVSVTDVPGLPVTTVMLDLPATRCPECTTDQVPTRSTADVRAVVIALFASDAGGV